MMNKGSEMQSHVKIGGQWITLDQYREQCEAVGGIVFLAVLFLAAFLAFWTWGGGL